jgi:hypothetical protein
MPETTDPDPLPLFADDVAALRRADSVVFHLHDGRSYIRAVARDTGTSDKPRTYTALEQRLFPDAAASGTPHERERHIGCAGGAYGFRLADSGTPTAGDRYAWRSTDEPAVSCLHMIHHARSESWQTVAGLLAPRVSCLALVWLADVHAELPECGYHADQLVIKIIQPRRVLHVELRTQIGRDDSGRMIRRHGRL